MTCPCPRHRGGRTWSITSTSISSRPRVVTSSRVIKTSYESPDRLDRLHRQQERSVRRSAAVVPLIRGRELPRRTVQELDHRSARLGRPTVDWRLDGPDDSGLGRDAAAGIAARVGTLFAVVL